MSELEYQLLRGVRDSDYWSQDTFYFLKYVDANVTVVTAVIAMEGLIKRGYVARGYGYRLTVKGCDALDGVKL